MSTLASAALSSYIARQVTTGQPVVFDEIIFCNIPNLTTNNLASHLTMPNSNQIVYRQVVSQVGFVNENAVVYSVTMGTEIGDFDFNYIGLINRQLNLLAVGVYTNTIKKIKNKNGIQGNAITRSILLEFANAKQITNITIPAQTWQIDFTARLSGIDEKIRLTNRDLYGRAVFFDDGFLVKRKTGNQFSIQDGVAYIEGVRASIATAQDITASLPCSIYLDVVHHCTVTGAYQTDIKFLKQHQNDYVDSAGRQHYVQVLADIARNGDITDRRERDKKYIPIEDKSDSTTSNSSDTVATSKAVKDVRDIAESKQSPATTLAGYGISDFKVGMIATDESINNYTTPGFYYFERRGSKTAEPYISSSGASLEVIALSNRDIVQRFYSSNSQSGYQERTYINGGWSSWANIKAITDNGTTSDMNYATNSGIYVAYRNAKNTPDGTAIWSLDVISFGGNPHQIARKRGSFETYERYRADNTWSEWKRTDGVDWSDVREAPTTLSGYGITDGVSRDALIGIPLPYPLSPVPSDCLAMIGQPFDKSRYPKLAKKYPSGVLPDLRAEFIRGWDNGRGVDRGRALLSYQGDAIRNITGYGRMFTAEDNNMGSGAINVSTYANSGRAAGSGGRGLQFDFDASRVVPTADENRPRNIAFQYICLAG